MHCANLIAAAASLALLTTASCSCEAPPNAPDGGPIEPGPCDSDTLQNTLDASAPTTAASDVARYRYRAPLDDSELSLALLDQTDAELGTLREWQRFDDEAPRRGALQAELGSVTLWTWASTLPSGAHRMFATLTPAAGPPLLIEATFEDRPCRAAELPAPLACAPGVSLSPDDALVLPGCGLDFDERLARGELPTLVRLRYRVPVVQAAARPSGAGLDAGDVATGSIAGPAWVFDAVYEGDFAELDARRAFLAEAGVLAWLEGDDARRLLAVYADPAWSRLLRQHVAHCLASGAFDDDTSFTAQRTAQALSSGSSGKRDSGAWGGGGGGHQGASSRGDPHLTTFDGHSYDLQSRAELLMARSPPAPGSDVPVHEVQARFEPKASARPSPLCASVSYTTAVAARAGDSILEVRAGLQVLWDGVEVAPGDEVTFTGENAPLLDFSRNEVRLSWADGATLTVLSSGAFVALEMTPGSVWAGRFEGLFGDGDGDPANDLRLADGTTLATPAGFTALHGALRAAWSVEEPNSLFTYDSGLGHADFDDPAFPATAADPSLISVAERAALEAQCRAQGALGDALMDCLIDLYCGDDLALADDSRAAAGVVRQRPSGAALMGDVVEAGYQGALDTDAPASADRCDALDDGALVLLPEARLTLSDALELDAAGPGPLTGPPVSVPAGAQVRGYTLFLPRADDERPLAGSVRFEGLILGAALRAATLDATDALLPEGASVQGAGRGLDGPDSVLEISADRRTLSFSLTQGDEAELVRLLVQEVTP